MPSHIKAARTQFSLRFRHVRAARARSMARHLLFEPARPAARRVVAHTHRDPFAVAGTPLRHGLVNLIDFCCSSSSPEHLGRLAPRSHARGCRPPGWLQPVFAFWPSHWIALVKSSAALVRRPRRFFPDRLPDRPLLSASSSTLWKEDRAGPAHEHVPIGPRCFSRRRERPLNATNRNVAYHAALDDLRGRRTEASWRTVCATCGMARIPDQATSSRVRRRHAATVQPTREALKLLSRSRCKAAAELESSMLELLTRGRRAIGESRAADPSWESRRHERQFARGYFAHITPRAKSLTNAASKVRYLIAERSRARAHGCRWPIMADEFSRPSRPHPRPSSGAWIGIFDADARLWSPRTSGTAAVQHFITRHFVTSSPCASAEAPNGHRS